MDNVDIVKSKHTLIRWTLTVSWKKIFLMNKLFFMRYLVLDDGEKV